VPTDRLTPLDASFLHLENASAHMHVACVMIFAGGPPDYEDLLSHIDARLHLVPRYRQHLANVPFAQGRPVWVDDQGFDLRFHVRAAALPSPGSETELQVLAGRVFSQALRRDRPLWEMWLVQGLEGDRFAILSKTHHALVDGVSGMDILSVLFAPEEDAQSRRPWHPRAAPSSTGLLTEALVERAVMPRELVRTARAFVRRPQRLMGQAARIAAGAGSLARAGLKPAPPSPYNDSAVGPDRRFTWVRGSLDDLKAVKDSLGGTVNDVVLAVVSGALRRHLQRRGTSTDGMELKAFVPVSVRSDEERGQTGNRVSGMIAPLPVWSADPVERLRTISAAMEDVKASGQAVGAQALTELGGFAPPNLMSQAARLITRQRFVNLVVTNVPGPQFPLSLADRELLDIFPMVPLGGNLTMGVAIVSYNGTMDFGLVGDFGALADLDDLADDLAAAMDELRAAAGSSNGRASLARAPAGR